MLLLSVIAKELGVAVYRSSTVSSPQVLPDLSAAVPTRPAVVRPGPDPVRPVRPAQPGTGGFDPGPYAPIDVPSVDDRHLLNRCSWGVTRALLDEVAETGGARAWFEQQMRPDEIPDPRADEMADWWPNLGWTPTEKVAASVDGSIPWWSQEADLIRSTLVRRLVTSRQLLEVMVDVWSNLLHVTSPCFKSFAQRASYDRTIRAHALGTYVELLQAAVLHPAMLLYLDNARSTSRAPNENLGRELLELHTVGRPAGYTEDDVRDSTRILTGYRVDDFYEPFYSEVDHAVGPVEVLEFTHENALPDGRAMTQEYLRSLALHPATAQRVARRLAVRFVEDEPSQALVDHLSDVFVSSGTDIKATLRALVNHPDFAASVGAKTRTPAEDFANTFRVLGIGVLPPSDPEDAANVISTICGAMGQRPFDWPRPDGFPDVAQAWASASRMLGSWRVHKNTSAAVMPRQGAVFADPESFLPALPRPFHELVDHLCRLLLARPADDRLVLTACEATATTKTEQIDPTSPLLTRRFPVLLLALLDTPDHMTR